MGRPEGSAFTALVLATVLGGCVQTSHVDQTVGPDQLATKNRAVAVMRLGTPNPNCQHVGVLLGVRDGEGFRKSQQVAVANVRALAEAPVGEIELEPGEYHVIALSCVAKAGPIVVTDKVGTSVYRTSFAHFTLRAGEVVNVGYLHFDATNHQKSGFGKSLKPEVDVSEWPLPEIERFKRTRPELAAHMTTRLMIKGADPVTTEQQADTCGRWREAKAEGLAQSLPAGCEASASAH